METSQAVVLPPLQSPLHSRPEEPDRSLPRLGALAYQPIDSENGDIRLIEVLPGHYNDAIQMNLHTNNLGDKPNYEALSYAWGTTPSSNRAIINGYPVPVRESLDLGLRRLRLTDEPRTLWVDALCINQNDVRERSHQVQQMCRIYKSAKQVVIWLGEWPDLDTCPHPERCQSMLMEWLDGRSALSLWARSCLQPPGHVCQHAVEIVKLPWFRRLWIIQEFALASSKTMILGDRVTNSKDFFSAIRNCIQISIDYSSLSASDHKQQGQLIKHFDMFMEIEGNVLKNEAITLYEAWLLSQYFMATDPRDKIYGLLGIVKFHVTQPMIPDYSKAWPQVLAEATMVMISEEGLFPYMIRGFVFPSTEQPKEGYRMPSWVLDLSQRIRSDVIENVEDYSKYSGHKLDSEGTERRRRSLRLSEDFRTLYKHGWHVGTIKRICVFTFDLAMEGYWEHRRELGAGLHDFYHQVLKPKGVAPNHLYEAIKSRLDPFYDLERFVSSLQDHRDRFTPLKRFERGTDKSAVFLTDEGGFGATWLSNTFEIRANDVVVSLFERQMPFILRPVLGQSTYRMVNLAYVPGLSGTYIQFHSDVTSGSLDKVEQVPNDWIHDAAEGCLEYAIV